MPVKKGKRGPPKIIVMKGAGFGSFIKSAVGGVSKAFKAVKKFRPASKLLSSAAALGVPLPPSVSRIAYQAKQKGFGKKKQVGRGMGSKTGGRGMVIY